MIKKIKSLIYSSGHALASFIQLYPSNSKSFFSNSCYFKLFFIFSPRVSNNSVITNTHVLGNIVQAQFCTYFLTLTGVCFSLDSMECGLLPNFKRHNSGRHVS